MNTFRIEGFNIKDSLRLSPVEPPKKRNLNWKLDLIKNQHKKEQFL